VKKEDFPKGIRVKKETEFKKIIQQGRRKRGEYLIVFRLPRQEGGQKFGIKIARGIKKAVERNRIKRVIREVLRKNKDRFGRDEAVVVMCRSTMEGKDVRKLKEELENLIK